MVEYARSARDRGIGAIVPVRGALPTCRAWSPA